ncbi:RNA deprotection pyrophosphohydrolase [Alkalihalobacillus sp. LMS39]|uniref:RNA deprotection pyrophosphohydrolase n=1 Tax=Alkalihalobacillus sp. LMS39 TaxID=2924032 RepID=UPI001FB2C6A1|nr:nucleoside triphosphatase YtkD [Alkalihalobacillus sp. LMS39]UOE93536.1 nucleoside triphosphatase YtkD [Alkalihalobacillus sp. LMS39]
MDQFYDEHNHIVTLTFNSESVAKKPGHVWVICRYNNQWLLTNHAIRGLEFPGGKIEKGEQPKEAAIREVWEETGARIKSIQYVGQYTVSEKARTIIKSIYFATINSLEKKDTYYETNGPILLNKIPENIKEQEDFSFIMKDMVWQKTKEKIALLVKEELS